MNWREKVFPSNPLLRYGSTVVFVLSAFVMTLGLWQITQPMSSPLFLAAIMLSSWQGGFRAGVFATILSGLLIDYFFIVPRFELVGEMPDIIRLSVFVIEGGVLSWLISGKKIAGEEIRHSREQLLALSSHQQTLREAEQKRISLEIHDELGQALTGMKLEVHWVKKQLQESPAKAETEKKLDALSDHIDRTISTVRRISTELRPSILDDFGLIAAIEWQAREFERKTSIPCVLRTDLDGVDLNAETTTAVFRIFQESLTNITRHAQASSVEVILRALGGDFVMSVEDDGRGIDLDAIRLNNSLGILGMKERSRLIGGKLDIVPGDDGGTKIELRFPAGASA